MMRNEPKQEANLRKWLLHYALPFNPAAKRQGGKKKKAIYSISEERTTIKELAVPELSGTAGPSLWHPPHSSRGFNYPNNRVNQELLDQSPQKLISGYEIRYWRAKLVVQGNNLGARGAFQQHHIPELSQHVDLFSSGSSIGRGGDKTGQRT